MESCAVGPQKIMHGIATWSGNSAPGYGSEIIESGVSRRCSHAHGRSSAIHGSREVEAPQVSVGGEAGRRSRVRTQREIIRPPKRKDCHTRRRGGTWRTSCRQGEPVAAGQTVCELTRGPCRRHIHRREGEWWLPGAGRRETGSRCFAGTELQFRRMKSVQRRTPSSRDGRAAVRALDAPRTVKFTLRAFYRN